MRAATLAAEQARFNCGQKTRYADKKAAVTQINWLMRGHRRKRPEKLRAYPCPYCRGWHLARR